MGSFRIERHPEVIGEDLPVIYSFVAKNNEIAAERVLDAIGDTFDLLAQEPDAGVLDDNLENSGALLGGIIFGARLRLKNCSSSCHLSNFNRMKLYATVCACDSQRFFVFQTP